MFHKIAEFILQERLRELENRVADLEKATMIVSISIDAEIKDGDELKITYINPDLELFKK